MRRGPWTAEEDEKLLAYIQQQGSHGSWRSLPSKAGLERCGKSCRLRWTNYLRPDIKRGDFTFEEEQTIIQLHALIGNRWSAIARHLPKRTDNEIKNYWNTCLKKRLTKMGIDPITHKPNSLSHSKEFANISHIAQWESVRIQAEARLRNRAMTLPPPQPPTPPLIGLFDEASSILGGNPSSNHYDQNGAWGLMELDHLGMDYSSNYVDGGWLGFPSFMDGFEVPLDNSIERCCGVLEEISMCFGA